MKHYGRLARNISWQVASRVGTQGLAVLFTILLARGLGSRGFGEYAWIAAVIFVENALTTFGTDMLLIREIANLGSLERVPAALTLQLLLSTGIILLTWAVGPFVPGQSRDAVLGLQIYSLALIPLAFISVFTIILRGKQRMDRLMLLNLSGAALQLAGAAWFSRSGSAALSMARLAWILLACQAAAALLGALLTAEHGSAAPTWPGWRISKGSLLGLARASSPLSLLTLVGMLYQKLNVLMLASLGGAALTGWYSGAARAVEGAKTVHLGAFTALYPAMAETAAPGAPESLPWKGAYRGAWGLLLGGAVAAALALSLSAGPLISLLFGAGYAPSAGALQILAWILVPFTLNTFMSLALLAGHQEKQVLRVQVFGLAVLVASNAWAIPHFGLAGACLASLLAEGLQSLAYFLQAWGRLPKGEQVSRFFLSVRNGGGRGVPAVPRKVR